MRSRKQRELAVGKTEKAKEFVAEIYHGNITEGAKERQ
jgi:hypothetical protein